MRDIIHVKTDRRVKAHAQEVAERLGLSLSAIVNAYLRQLIRTGEVWFTTAPRMSPELERLLGKVESDIRRGHNVSRPITTAAELDTHLADV